VRLPRTLLRFLLLATLAANPGIALRAQQAASRPGLLVVARDDSRSVTFLAPTPNFTLTPQQSIHPQLKPAFIAEWTGYIKIPRAGRYTFFADAHVFINGREVEGQPVQLAAGENTLRIAFARKPGGPARLQLQWHSDHFAREPVPWTAFVRREYPTLPSLADTVPGPVVSEAPLQRFHQLARQLNCIECHELYGPPRRAFGANEAPPPLTDAGNKLRASWLEDVLVRNRRVRPWMSLLPAHGGETARELVPLFAQQAGAELGEGERAEPLPPAQLDEGAKLLGSGDGGLSCITCHDFKGRRSVGDLRGPDMVEMHARIRGDWLRRWLRDPGRIQQGTAMPAFFSEMPAAEAEAKIDRLLRTLAAGRDLPLPAGLDAPTADFKLAAHNEVVVHRTFIAESSPRSIAVGFPGGLSCVFDSEACRLRYVWIGGFLDVEPVWTGRGGGNAKAIGQRIFTAPNAFPLRLGSMEAEPKQLAFKGYSLVKSPNGAMEAVEFRFEADGVAVKQVLARSRGGGLEMRFNLGNRTNDSWFAATDSDKARVSSPDGEFHNGRLVVRGARQTRFTVRIDPK